MSNVYSIYDMKRSIQRHINSLKSKVYRIKNKMSFNTTLYTLLFTLSPLGLISCTDTWDDHYKSVTMGEGNLWESIKNNQELSNFAKVIEATGYDKSLASSQVFTVFAPTNNSFTDADANAIISKYQTELAKGLKGEKNTAIKEFVMNHIALYNYSVANETADTTIRMMNGKSIGLTNSTFSGKNFTSINKQTGNGVLFTIDDVANYIPNIFEYAKMDEELDSVRHFLYMSDPYQFHVEEFKESESVPGEIIKGKQHYLDSVTVTQNELLNLWLKAKLNNEDSCYYTLMPTNKAWKEQYDKNITLFQYDKKVAGRDSLMWVFPRFFILTGMQFSKTTNPLLGMTENLDSIVSPLAISYNDRKLIFGSYDIKPFQFENPYAPDGIFSTVKSKKVCSNGVVMKADKWNVDRRKTVLMNIVMEAEGRSTLDSLTGAIPEAKPSWTSTTVTSDNPFYNKVSNNMYYTLIPANLKDMGALFDFWNVLSNQKYDMYVVTAPATAGDIMATDTLPTRFGVTLYWHDMDGNEVSKVVSEEDGGEISYDSSTRKNTFLVDPTRVHEIHIGTFEFPTCSYNLPEAQVKALVEINVRGSDVTKKIYTRSLRIDQLKLVPHMEE